MAVTFKDDPKWRTDQPSDDNPTPYKALLCELAKEMTEDDLEIIKFMFKEDVGEGILEKVTSPFEIFEVLEDHGKIEPPKNLSKLEEGMKTAGREDLVTKIRDFCTKRNDAARQARRRKDTPWVSKSPFAAPNQPQVVEEEEEEEEEDEEKVQDSIQETDSSNGRSASDVVHPNRRLSTIPEDGHKRVALPPGNTDVIEEETQQTPKHSGEAAKTANTGEQGKTSGNKGKAQEGEDNSSSKKTSSKDIPMTTSGKKKSSKFCVLL